MLNRLFTPRGSEERDLSFQQVFGAGLDVSALSTWAGNSVSQKNSLQIGAVYACVRLLSDTISSLPVDTFVRRDGNRVPFRPQPAWVSEPDGPGSSRIDYYQQLIVSMLISHGAVVQILRDTRGGVVALTPLDPSRVDVVRNMQTRRPEFSIDGGKAMLSADEVLYIPELKRPGTLKGVSRIEEVKNTLGLAKALDEFASRYFSNGASTSGIIEFPGNLTQEQAKDVVTAFESAHKGVARSHRPGVLSGGAKFAKVGSDAEQAQMLQSRQFAVEEIARIFRVPPSMIGLNTPGAMSYASVEHNAIQFVRYSLLPLISKIEEAHSRLLPNDAFLRMNVDGLQRGDSTAQAQVFSTAMQAGYMSVNDVRTIMDMQPVDGGELPRVPLANISVGAASLIEEAQRVDMAMKLVGTGYEPAAVLAALGLPAIDHTGLPTVQLQNAAQAGESGVNVKDLYLGDPGSAA